MSSRLIITKIIAQVVEDKRTLSTIFSNHALIKKAGSEKAFIQEMSYGSLRWYIQLEFLLNQLLDKPIKTKNSDLKYLLISGLYQLLYMNIASHAVVSETVETCVPLKKQWARGLVNAVLRRYLRDPPPFNASFHDLETQASHPKWLIAQLKEDWSQNWQHIIDENNKRPPMYLRVNRIQQGRQQYLEKLYNAGIKAYPTPLSEQGILLEKPINVSQLPGFDAGTVSVQELAAQLSANLLDLHVDQLVLDACAAPGGKSAHILESKPKIKALTAIEKDPQRAGKLTATLNRLKLNPTVKIADVLDIDTWWDKSNFDRILLDAPCSATGVIRRHPDIKTLCSTTKISKLNKLQRQLLETLWHVLKRKGLLLYVTCSVLKKENSDMIKYFLKTHDDAVIKPIKAKWGLDTGYGRQILTGENNMDGFFYACLEKK